MLDLSIIIVSYNTEKLLKKCILSVVKNIKDLKYEIVVVDNDSTDGSIDMLQKYSRNFVSAAEKYSKNRKGGAAQIRDNSCFPRLKLIKNNNNLGFAKANNIGIKKAKGKYILLLNSDTQIKSEIFTKLLSSMSNNKNIGAVTCALEGPDGKLQGPGGYFPTLFKVIAWMFFIDDIPYLDFIIKPFHPVHSNSPFYKGNYYLSKKSEKDWIAGTFFLTRSEIFDKVGVFDEDYFMYVEDVDLCWRIKKAGWKIFYLPEFSIEHYGGASSVREFPIISEYKGLKLFYKKHMPPWQSPVLKLFLKAGALLRIVVFGILKGKEESAVYAKAFKVA